MIIITLTTGFKIKYKGDIELQADDTALHVGATDHDDNLDNLYTCDRQVYDVIWLKDIESIVGE